jgi:hypothetical protein
MVLRVSAADPHCITDDIFLEIMTIISNYSDRGSKNEKKQYFKMCYIERKIIIFIFNSMSELGTSLLRNSLVCYKSGTDNPLNPRSHVK